MLNDKLQEIGNKLNLSDQDISDIERRRKMERIFKTFIMPIVAIFSFILGSIEGSWAMFYTYPYYISGFGMSIQSIKKGKISLKLAIIGALTSTIAFLLGLFVGFFSSAIMYSVYHKNKVDS